MQKLVKQVNTKKSTNNSMSSFGLIEENMQLSHIHLAVLTLTSYNDHVFLSYDAKVQYELNKFLLKDDACMISYHVLKEKVDFSPTFA